MTYLSDDTRARLKRRDREFLDELFRELNPYLLRCLSSRGLFSDEADDVVCETWLTFLEKLDTFEGRSTVKTYITGILFHKIQESQRARSKFVALEEDTDEIFERAFTRHGRWKQMPSDPIQLIQHQETGALIEKCMEGLSPQQRDAFILKELEEEESDLICNSLKISVSNLGVLIFRAKEKLRKCLEGALSLKSTT